MSTTGSLPPLPQIDNRDLLLEVCTHKDLRPRYRDEPCEWGDSERLADMGFRILELVVTSSLFSKRPIILAEELRTFREHWTSPVMLNSWINSYQLKQRLRVPPDQSHAILNDMQQMARYFHTYVGAVYVTKGLQPVERWISQIINPDSNVGSQTSSSSSSSTQVTGANVPVFMLNQVAAQRHLPINYVASSEGSSHLPTWTVRCYINNVERGVGVAGSQKAAKEEAARRAWIAMGW